MSENGRVSEAEGSDAQYEPYCCCRCCGRSTALGAMIALNSVVMLSELGAGCFTHSVSLIADAFHMVSDVIALVVALACLRIARRRRDPTHTFGWVRAEVLGALVNGVFLLALCLSILLEAIMRFIQPEAIQEPLVVIIVGVVGLTVNLVGICLFHRHSHHHHHHHHNRDSDHVHRPTVSLNERKHLRRSYQRRALEVAHSTTSSSGIDGSDAKQESQRKSRISANLNMRGAFLHMFSDSLGSVVVIVAGFVAWMWPQQKSLNLYLDPSVTLIMVGIMVVSTVPFVWEAALILLQTTPAFVSVDTLKQQLLQIDGVTAVHEFHVWRLVGERVIATVHVRFRELSSYLAAEGSISSLFHRAGVHSVTVQPEFVNGRNSSETGCETACPPLCAAPTAVTCCSNESMPSKQKQQSPLVSPIESGTAAIGDTVSTVFVPISPLSTTRSDKLRN